MSLEGEEESVSRRGAASALTGYNLQELIGKPGADAPPVLISRSLTYCRSSSCAGTKTLKAIDQQVTIGQQVGVEAPAAVTRRLVVQRRPNCVTALAWARSAHANTLLIQQ